MIIERWQTPWEQYRASDLDQNGPEMASSTGAGADPDQGHVQKWDWTNNLGRSRPGTANSTEAGFSQQPRPEKA